MPKHRPRSDQQQILHDFDEKTKILRILFVDPKGTITPVTYQLCPVCGVTMDEKETAAGLTFICVICGLSARG